MPSTQLIISSDPVPKSFCPITDPNWQVLVGLLHATLSGDPTINYGNPKPTSDKRNLSWFRLNTDGSPDRWYAFDAGQWISRHALPPDFVGIYAGDPSLIPTFDGGNANSVSAYDGPFWKRLPNADAKFLIQAGTTPAPASTVLSVGATGGEEKHVLIDTEIAHRHFVASDELMNPITALTPTVPVAKQSNYDGAGAPNSYYLSGGAGTLEATLGLSSKIGDPANRLGHNTMPPYLVVTFIQRTQRLFYSIPA